MFVGRQSELTTLNRLYAGDRFECVVIYGRRRVGKTTLIREFLKGKKGIYFVAREASGEINLLSFSGDVYSVTEKALAGNAFFADWEKALAYLHEISRDERIILAIDEYPYLAQGYRPISSILQAQIDHGFKEGKLFLILCGSSMSFMENQVLGYQSPLYGRRTAQLKIRPFGYLEALPFLTGYSSADRAVLYGVTGGIPEYLSRIDPTRSVRENLIALFLTPSGLLFEEPSNLLKQELREPATYNGIIEAIATGASRLNEIATKTGMESNKCAKYLASLMALGIVGKEVPVTQETAKRTIYRLEDQMFRFWYRFVFPNLSAIAQGLGEGVYAQDVEPQLSAYMGPIFEQICLEYLFELLRRDALPFFIGSVGRWWGNNPKKKRQEEIDILAVRDDCALFGECKWTNAAVDVDVLRDLVEQSELFSYEKRYFYLFAKTGFTQRLRNEAERMGNVVLIAFDEMQG